MAEEPSPAKQKKNYIVHTIGGEPLVITAHDMSMSYDENRIYFKDADGKVVEKWIVFLSGVAVVEVQEPQPAVMGRLTIR